MLCSVESGSYYVCGACARTHPRYATYTQAQHFKPFPLYAYACHSPVLGAPCPCFNFDGEWRPALFFLQPAARGGI